MTTFATSQAPPQPNADELDQLSRWLCEQGYDPDTAMMTATTAYVAVYDEYVTGCPGYCGKVLSVVWDGSPSCFDVFTWCDGVMAQEERENG